MLEPRVLFARFRTCRSAEYVSGRIGRRSVHHSRVSPAGRRASVSARYSAVLGTPLLGQLLQRCPSGLGVDGGVDGLHIVLERVPVPPRGEPEGVADQVDDARLDRGQRPHIADHLGQTLQAVADHEEGVLDSSVAQVGQHTHPELRALPASASPQPKYVGIPDTDAALTHLDDPDVTG